MDDLAALQELQRCQREWAQYDRWHDPSMHRSQMEWKRWQKDLGAEAYSQLEQKWTLCYEELLQSCDDMLEQLREAGKPMLRAARGDNQQVHNPALQLLCCITEIVSDAQQQAVQSCYPIYSQKSLLEKKQSYWCKEINDLLDIASRSEEPNRQLIQEARKCLQLAESYNLEAIPAKLQALARNPRCPLEEDLRMIVDEAKEHQGLPGKLMHSYHQGQKNLERVRLAWSYTE